jgi:hypothetical protein
MHPNRLCRLLTHYQKKQERIFLDSLTSLQFRTGKRYKQKLSEFQLPKGWKLGCTPEVGKKYFVTITSDLQGTCFDHDMIDWSLSSKMCKYIPQEGKTVSEVEDMGYGSVPTDEYYLPLPLEKEYRGYLHAKDFSRIARRMERLDTRVILVYLGAPELIRMGNCRGSFGESELHGQAPGEPVYPVVFLHSISQDAFKSYITQASDVDSVSQQIKTLQTELARTNQDIASLQGNIHVIHDRMEQENITEDRLPQQDRDILLQYRDLRMQTTRIMRQIVSLRRT